MSDVVDEAALLIHQVVERLSPSRRTFTEREALEEVWNAGYDISIQSDVRFVLALEAWKHPSHWRLTTHALANGRLLNDLLTGSWDGRDLDGKLAALDAEDQMHYVYCPLDPRLTLNKQGILEPVERERMLTVPRHMKATLDKLGSQLLTYWREAGNEPWTLRTITEELKQLGWQDGEMHNAWLYVRSWLLSWSAVERVGQDYWILSDQLPQDVQRMRLHVLPIRTPPAGDTIAVDETAENSATTATRRVLSRVQTDESQVVLSGEATATRATWSVRLRTVNLLEGFLHIPASARAAYPLAAPGEKEKVLLRGVWFEDNTHFWLWLDRAKQHLHGPSLAEKLGWQDAGDILRIEWAPDVIVIRITGHDEEVKREESRLVDLEALSALRGGLGESYRRSLQAILLEHPQGLVFSEVVNALRKRQNHEVHRGTIHALLHSGGFVQREGHWYAAPDNDASAHQLRTALVETLVPPGQSDAIQSISYTEQVRVRVKAIRSRLSEIVIALRQVP